MTKWFISYKFVESDFLLEQIMAEGFGVVITDVSPARWTLYARIAMNREHYVLYAEEISPALAVEMVHGGAGVPTSYFKETDQDEDFDIG